MRHPVERFNFSFEFYAKARYMVYTQPLDFFSSDIAGGVE